MTKSPKGNAAYDSAKHCDARDVQKWLEPHLAASSFLSAGELKAIWYSELAARRYADICELTDKRCADRGKYLNICDYLDSAERFIDERELNEEYKAWCDREDEGQHPVGDDAIAEPPLSSGTVERFNRGERIV